MGTLGVSTLAFVVMLVLAAGAASASAASYTGKVKGQASSEIEFRVHKVRGKRKITDIRYELVAHGCDSGDQTVSGPIYADGRVRERDRTFDVRYEDGTFKQRFAGRLKRKGRAAGMVKTTTVFPPSDVCKSGKVRWVAKRG